MKGKFLLAAAAALFTCSSIFAQKSAVLAPSMPVDEDTKLITFSAIVDVPATTKNEIYARTLEWFNAYYKNPGEVIRERDSVNLKITGKPRFRITNEPNENGVKLDAGIVQYTINVAAKDNKAKYTISEINWKQQSYFPIEKWVAEKDRYKQNNYYIYSTDSVLRKDVIPALEKALKTAKKKVDKDNW